MELEYNYQLERDIYNLETLFNNDTLCCVCGIDEKEEKPELNEYWNKYKLKCGHIAHTRCYRRFGLTKPDIKYPCPYRCEIKYINIKKNDDNEKILMDKIYLHFTDSNFNNISYNISILSNEPNKMILSYFLDKQLIMQIFFNSNDNSFKYRHIKTNYKKILKRTNNYLLELSNYLKNNT